MFGGLVDTVRVLSLPAAEDRRARLPGHLGAFGIEGYELVDAFGPEAPEVQALFDEGRVMRFPPCFRCGGLRCDDDTCNNLLIPAQVANFASFLAIWREVAETPQVALILEDDVQFHPWARRAARFLRRQVRRGRIPLRPDEPMLVRLGWPHDDDHRWRAFHKLRDRVRMSNPCYILTSAFAAALLDRFDGVKTTSDVYLHRVAPRPGEALTLFPPMATELSFALGQMDSAIHPKQAYLDHLAAEGREAERAAHAARLKSHIKHIYHRPILCVGHPRSGTKFVAEVCSQLGLDVGHEDDGKDGISSWMCAVDAEENPWAKSPAARTRRALHWEVMVQVVRDPATAVPSIMRENRHAPDSYAFRRAHILRLTGTDLDRFEDETERALASLCLWNRIIRDQSPDLTVRIEHDHEALVGFLRDRGFAVETDPDLDLSPVNTDKKYRKKRYEKPEVAAGDWRGLSAGARALLDEYCADYGYPDPAESVGA